MRRNRASGDSLVFEQDERARGEEFRLHLEAFTVLDKDQKNPPRPSFDALILKH